MSPFNPHDGRKSYPVAFWHRARMLGVGSRPAQAVHNKLVAPESRAFFCPYCGEVWARAYVEGQPFQSYVRSCEKHSSDWLWLIPGSLWIDWDYDYQRAMPEAALQWEFQLHLAQWDRLKEKDQ